MTEIRTFTLQDKLPRLPNDAKNRLVQIGSGNNNNNVYKDTIVAKAAEEVPGSNYDPNVDIDRGRFVSMLDRAKSTKVSVNTINSIIKSIIFES